MVPEIIDTFQEECLPKKIISAESDMFCHLLKRFFDRSNNLNHFVLCWRTDTLDSIDLGSRVQVIFPFESLEVPVLFHQLSGVAEVAKSPDTVCCPTVILYTNQRRLRLFILLCRQGWSDTIPWTHLAISWCRNIHQELDWLEWWKSPGTPLSRGWSNEFLYTKTWLFLPSNPLHKFWFSSCNYLEQSEL